MQGSLERFGPLTHHLVELVVEVLFGIFQQVQPREAVALDRDALQVSEVFLLGHRTVLVGEQHRHLADLLTQAVLVEHLRRTGAVVFFVLGDQLFVVFLVVGLVEFLFVFLLVGVDVVVVLVVFLFEVFFLVVIFTDVGGDVLLDAFGPGLGLLALLDPGPHPLVIVQVVGTHGHALDGLELLAQVGQPRGNGGHHAAEGTRPTASRAPDPAGLPQQAATGGH